jgi:hypothetical protein
MKSETGSTCPRCGDSYFFECLSCGYVPSAFQGDWTIYSDGTVALPPS